MKHIKGLVVCCAALLTMYNSYAQPNISRIEYYIDSDPGFGKATSISFTAGTNISNASFNIDPASLSAGFHILGIRSKNANGGWSFDNKWLFAKPYPSGGTTTPFLKKVEYYLDKDPGFGKATDLPFTHGTNLSNLTINIDPATLTTGFHILGVRSLDSTGKWSLDNKWFFAKPFPAAGATPLLSNIEYYLDKDPGYGKGIAVSFASGTNLSNATFNIDPSALGTGIHILGIRARDANGFWGEDNKWLFTKPFPALSSIVDTLSLVEYYIDNDPGYGKAIPVATGKVTNLSNINLSINISGLGVGSHHLFIRGKTQKGVWSLDNKFDFGISSTVASPSIVVSSLSKKTICVPDTFKVGYQKSGTYNSGNIFKVQLSNSSGSFSSPVVIGSFTGITNSVITCIVPPGTVAGNRYRVRIVSTNPAVTGVKSIDSLNITSCGNLNAALSPVLAARYSSVQMDEPEEADEMNLYPNPANNNVYLAFTSSKPATYLVELTDITGKVLFRKTGKSLRGINKVNFDISKYANGMFMLNLKNKKDAVKSVMFNKHGK